MCHPTKGRLKRRLCFTHVRGRSHHDDRPHTYDRGNRPPAASREPRWRRMTPVVLIAEELAPSAIDVLAYDFDVRHVDGTDRAALLAALAEADALIVRSATRIDAEAVAAAPPAQGRRPGRRRPGQRRRARRHRPRRHGGQRADLQHRVRRRAGHRAAAGGRPAHRQRQRRAQARRVEALEVHRRRGAGQDRRRGRAGPDRGAVRAADGRLRHPADRVRPLHPAGPGRAARRAPGRARRAAAGERLHLDPPAAYAGDPRPDRREGTGHGQAGRPDHQRRPRRPDRRAGAGRRAGRGPGRRRRHRRLRHRADHRVAAVRASTTWWSPRTWAPRPSRRRTRPASRWPAASSWRCRASSCRTR